MPMGGVELLVVLVIILLFFGAKRVPQLAKSLGVGARELKKAASEDPDESETKEASVKEASVEDAAEAKTEVVSEDAPSARGEDRAERKAPDQ
jgi:sec-independent protein translocase protein TatA